MLFKLVVALLIPSALSVPFDYDQIPLRAESAYPQIALPHANSTKSFWIDSPGANPLAKEGSTGPLTTAADVCIIGSGISGVGAAYKLSEEDAGLNVTILEARDFCSGATGRNGGHLTTYVFQSFSELASQYGIEEAKRGFALENYTSRLIVKIIEEHGLNDIVDLVHGGHTSITMSEKAHAKRVNDFNEARTAGLDLSSVTWYTREEMNATFGAHFPGFTFDAYNLWPLKFVTHAFKIAQSRFASSSGTLVMHTNTPVTRVISSTVDKSKWDLVTPRGSISCQYVLHATNAYSGHLLPSMRGPDGIVPTRGQVIAVHSKNTGPSSWSNGQGEYWFPRPGGDEENPLVILGGGRDPNGDFPVTDDSVLNPVAGKALRKFFPTVFGVDERKPEMEWTGIMGYTKSGDPFVGPLEYLEEGSRGQYISAGLAGHGMPRAFSCAQAVALMIVADMKNKVWPQPEWLPNRYLTKNRV